MIKAFDLFDSNLLIFFIVPNSEEISKTPEPTQKPPGIASNIQDGVAQKIETQWRDLAEKIGLKDTVNSVVGNII